jgi:outer membrane immunogenic protein
MNRQQLYFACCTLGLALAALPAQAQTYKAPPLGVQTYDWSGPYIGFTAGYAAGTADASTSSPTLNLSQPTMPPINTVGAQKLKPTGFSLGGLAGYNWQVGSLVFGGEAEMGVLDTSASQTGTGTVNSCVPCNFSIQQTVSTGWLAMAGPRVGYAFGNVLVFANGGVAVTDLNYQSSFQFTSASFAGSITQGQIPAARAGWEAGGGIEFGLTRHWALRAQYLHLDFGTVSTSNNFLANTQVFPFNFSTSLKYDLFRAGVDYRFN